MRYWCSKCGSEFSPAEKVFANLFIDDDEIECPFCETRNVCKLPDFETPGRYKKRTGNELSNNAAVWVKDGENDLEGWRLDYLNNAIDDQRYFVIITQSPEPPPDDFVPECV